MDAAQRIKLSDFTVDRFISMPCFRGHDYRIPSHGCIRSSYILIHKNVQNYELVCWWVLGNIIGWEQCRSLRRKSFQMIEKAQQERDEKNKRNGQKCNRVMMKI